VRPVHRCRQADALVHARHPSRQFVLRVCGWRFREGRQLVGRHDTSHQPSEGLQLFCLPRLFHSRHLIHTFAATQIPQEIDDPSDKKPADWVDVAEIDDETATKPDDWDEDAPEFIVDEDAVKPAV
jgi:hypothetical protein